MESATGSNKGTNRSRTSWADFQVRSAIAIRRHQTLVNCAFLVLLEHMVRPTIHKRQTDRAATAVVH